jgi:hypothetical protein
MFVLRNSTAHFAVYYDDQLSLNGIDGPSLADAELARCETDYMTLSSWFGVAAPPNDLPVHINIAWNRGSGGGSNDQTNNLWVNCTSTTHGSNVNEIAVAELAELFMAWQNIGRPPNSGWVAVWSHGEGLSRALPPVLYSAIDPNAYFLWENATGWLNNGRPNWIDASKNTDQDHASYGCALFFLYYLNGQLNFTWPQIIQAAAPTLAQVAANLGVQEAWSDFIALIDYHYPPGVPVYLQADNVFPLAYPDFYTLTGTVLEADGGGQLGQTQPLAAKISISPAGIEGFSDGLTGIYKISGIPPGQPQTVTASGFKHTAQKREVQFRGPHQIFSMDFVLYPVPYKPPRGAGGQLE